MGLLRIVAASLLALLLCGCGNVRVNGNAQFNSITGFISSVQVTSNDSSANGQLTVVIFLNQGSSQTVNFCGNVSNKMPLNQTATVNFTSGASCSTLLSISIHT